MASHKTSPATQGCRNKNRFVNHILLHSGTCSHGDSQGPTYEKDILAKKMINMEKTENTLSLSVNVLNTKVVIEDTMFMPATERLDCCFM